MMGINKRAGLLVKLFGFCFLFCACLAIAGQFNAFAQNNNSGSANIKAPKNLKKSNANKSDSTNSNSDNSNEQEDKKEGTSESSDSNKDSASVNEKSDSKTNNGSPYGAFIPPDRVHWEHPDAKDQSSIKQNTKTNVKPVEKPKVAKVKPVPKSGATAKSKPSAKTSKSKNVKSNRGSSPQNTPSKQTNTSNIPPSEEIIAQEEPVENTITESEGVVLPNDTPGANTENSQPTEAVTPDSEASDNLVPEKSEENTETNQLGAITTPPSDELDDTGTGSGTDDTGYGLDESTQLNLSDSEDDSTIKTPKSLYKSDLQDVLKAIGYLLLVLALLTVLWLAAKWLTGFREGPALTQRTKVLHQMDLGMNQKLKLIQSGNMVLVLGVSPNGVQLFDKFPVDELDTHDWSTAVNSKAHRSGEDIHIAPTESPKRPKPATKASPEPAYRVPSSTPAQEDTYQSSAKGKSFTFRGGKLVERNEFSDQPISQSPAQEKLISQIRSKVKQWDL